MITKEEMEDIWNNKPIGYLKDFLKRQKKVKKYVIKICSVSSDENPQETFVIESLGSSANHKWMAEQEAIKLYKQKYPDLKHSSWRYNVSKV